MRLQVFHALVFSFVAASPSWAEPASTLRDLSEQIATCLIAPVDGELTLRLVLSREGELRGTPHLSFKNLPLTEEQERHVTEMIGAALGRCLPAQITPTLGKAIGGRGLVLRFMVKRRETGV
jgi:hypothetical protein